MDAIQELQRAKSELEQDQREVIEAFADAIKAEKQVFIEQGLLALDDTISLVVNQALESVNDIDDEGAATEIKDMLINAMHEAARRGLQRAIKTIAKGCEE